MTLRHRISPETRLKSLDQLIHNNRPVRAIEAHNGLSALIGEEASVKNDGKKRTFDAFWLSSLTGTAVQGLPDAELLDYQSRIETIDEVLNVTQKPLIVDADTGGSPSQFEYFVDNLQRLGVSAVIIEDKQFPKRNSLDASANQDLESPNKFANKLERGNNIKRNEEFMIIARIESLIAGEGMKDALLRAQKYLESGVDGIMIHSKESNPDKILEFAQEYETLCAPLADSRPPLIVVPTTYNSITDKELAQHGCDIIIHANHLLRSAHKAMKDTAEEILRTDRGSDVEPYCSPTSEIFETVGFDRIKSKDT